MNNNDINNHRQHLGLWNKKSMNLLMAFEEYEILFGIRKKIIFQQLHEIRQLAQDLNIDNIQLRKMILESVADIGVSESWLRKLLPETLKLTKHTRKDYLKRQIRRDQQPLQQLFKFCIPSSAIP